jgi:hypothetical protein
METNNSSNPEQHSGSQFGEVSNEQAIPGNADYNQSDAGNQEDFPENGSQTQTGAAGDNGVLSDETGYGDDIQSDDIDDDDESANDVDGNGGYPDAANPS